MRGRLVMGLLLLIVGVWWILELAGVDVPPGGLGTWWPSLLIAWGLSRYVVHPRWRLGPLFLIALGALLQADKLGYLPERALAYSIPVFLLLMGLALVLSVRRHRRVHGQEPWRRQYGFRVGTIHPRHDRPAEPPVIDVTRPPREP